MTKRTGMGDQGSTTDTPGPRARLGWALRVGTLLFVLWLLLSGFSAWMVGAGVALAGGLAGAWLSPGDGVLWRWLRLPRFFAYFVGASFLGGVDVARRAFAPRVAVDPCLARYPLRLPAGPARTLVISVVSLLPGTLSADLSDDGRWLVVHGLTPSAFDTLAGLEDRVGRLFGIDLPPAEPVVHVEPRGGA